MKAAIFVKPGQMECHDIAKPRIEQPTDALIKVVRASVCGSDMWWYRGITPYPSGNQEGHEAIGIVEEVGSQVTNVKLGDFVICPFTHGCGHCPACRAGFEGNCENFGYDIKMAIKPNIFVIQELTGAWLKYRDNLVITAMSNSMTY